jgi:hypothetical protein
LPIHSAGGAAAFAAKQVQHLDTRVMDFSERAGMATQVAQFAYDNGSVPLARAELTRAADCLIGYGWRKDMFALEVLYAIERLRTIDNPAARDMVLEVAAACDAITDYTDGDETDHIRSYYYGLLARVFPERGVACYRALLEREEWRYADELLRDVIETLPDDPARTALLRTFIQANEFNTVSKLADEGRDSGVLAYLNQINGQTPATKRRLTRQDLRLSRDLAKKRRRLIDVAKFPATALPALLARITKRGEVGDAAKTLIAWLDHWEAQGQGAKVLDQLATHVGAEQSLSIFDRLLDAAFKMSLRVQGRSKAFKWAVLAHRHRYGWQRWLASDEDTIQRLDMVAKEFPGRWQEFIVATSDPVWAAPGERGSRVIGLSRLVYFLVAAGQAGVAEAYVRSMIKVLKEEISNQPLRIPTWAA